MEFDFDRLTLVDARRLLESGACTSVEMTAALAARIRARDPEIRAYLTVDEGMALRQAEAADAARAAGQTGPLLGIPLGIKDLLNVEGQPCTCSAHMLEGYVSPYDATAIARLRAAGAVFLGRTNMDEFAMGSSTENSAFQVTRNPVDTTRVPGGSSGGSAAALAAGEAIATLGTDTGGRSASRRPSAAAWGSSRPTGGSRATG